MEDAVLKIVVGTSVEGHNFFGREEDLEDLGRMVETDHVLLLAPRRVGKSSLLKAVLPGPTADGRIPVFVDVQDCKTERELIRTLFAAIHATPAGRRLRPGPVARWRERRTSRVTSVQMPGGVGVELAEVDHGWQRDADRQFER